MSTDKKLYCFISLIIMMVSSKASAAIIYFEEASKIGNRYEYNYSFFNDSSIDVDWFTIWFDADSYQNLEITNSPTDWDPIVAEPDPFFGDGFADWFSFGAPIEVGEILSGFSLAFDWIGAEATPFSSQHFEVYDSSNSGLIEYGSTSKIGAPVPEPSTTVLMMLVVGYFMWAQRRKFLYENGTRKLNKTQLSM